MKSLALPNSLRRLSGTLNLSIRVRSYRPDGKEDEEDFAMLKRGLLLNRKDDGHWPYQGVFDDGYSVMSRLFINR